MASSMFARNPSRSTPPPICIKPPQERIDLPNTLPPFLYAAVSWYPEIEPGEPFDLRTTLRLEQLNPFALYYAETNVWPNPYLQCYLFIDAATWESTFTLYVFKPPMFANHTTGGVFQPTATPPYTTRLISLPPFAFNPTARAQATA